MIANIFVNIQMQSKNAEYIYKYNSFVFYYELVAVSFIELSVVGSL